MENLLKFTTQSQGRDVLFRATQYACVLAKYLLRNDPKRNTIVLKLQSLESNMSSGRKLFRLGNTVNSIDAATRTLKLSDPVLRVCLTMANLERAVYFICDNVLWARSISLIQDLDKDRWSLNSTRFYFLSLVTNLVRDAYVIAQLMIQMSVKKQCQQNVNQQLSQSPNGASVIYQFDVFLLLFIESLRSHPAVALDTLKNICDLFIPLEKFGVYKTNAGIVGLCGLVSSLVGILLVHKPSLKIKP